MKDNFRRTILLLFAMLPMHNSFAVPANSIGMVDIIQGEVYAISATGERRQLSSNAPIYVGDSIETENGAVVLVMADGTQFDIYDNSRLRINAYQFQEQNSDHAEYTIENGQVDYFSGDMEQRDNEVAFITPHQVIKPQATGLGTEIRFYSLPDGTVTGYVAAGKVEVERNNDGGSVSANEGQFFIVEQNTTAQGENENEYVTTVTQDQNAFVSQIQSTSLPSNMTMPQGTTQVSNTTQQEDENTNVIIGGGLATTASPQ
ncbi:MAG: hypothetical protein ABFS56_25300 [Pseudomonadota bacterium]